jgi:uncharacterized protein (TIGR02246 family)
MRSIWIGTIALSLTTLTASVASAQGIDQNTRQQIEQIVAAYHDNWNNHNAAGIAGLYTKDGVLVTQAPKAVKTGQQEIEQNYKNAFSTLPQHDSATVDELSPLGANMAFSVGQYHLTGKGDNGPTKIDGYWTAVYVREGDTWKVQLLTAVPNPPPAGSASAAPASGPAR